MIRLSTSTIARLALLCLGTLPLWMIAPLFAQVLQPGRFTATQDCPAQRAINGANPGNIRVIKGQTYEAIGFNSQARRYVLLNIAGANPPRRWVSAACGRFTDASSTTPPATPDRPTNSPRPTSGLLPFFDTVNNPVAVRFSSTGGAVDITPPPPRLSNFDQAVLKTCGAIGTKVNANSVRQLFAAYPDVVKKAKQQVGGALLSGRTSDAEFLDDLVAVWTNREGFEHIFCGELEGAEKIGGLHFYGRYLQLQTEGIGGRLPNNSRNEEVIPGVVYTLGIVIRQGNRTFTDDLKGYPYPSDAMEMLLDATRLVKAQGNIQGACIAQITDASGQSYAAVFVKDRAAIVTFYPDATPKGKACR